MRVYLLGLHPLLGGLGVGKLDEGEPAGGTCGIKMAGTEIKQLRANNLQGTLSFKVLARFLTSIGADFRDLRVV